MKILDLEFTLVSSIDVRETPFMTPGIILVRDKTGRVSEGKFFVKVSSDVKTLTRGTLNGHALPKALHETHRQQVLGKVEVYRALLSKLIDRAQLHTYRDQLRHFIETHPADTFPWDESAQHRLRAWGR